MKKLIPILIISFFTLSCKKDKTSPQSENNKKEETAAYKKFRIEINTISGNHENFNLYIVLSDLFTKTGLMDEPLFIKPENLKFKNFRTYYQFDSYDGKTEKTYVIESENPVNGFQFAFFAEERKENKGEETIKLKIFIDNKLIRNYNYQVALVDNDKTDVYLEYFDMKKY